MYKAKKGPKPLYSCKRGHRLAGANVRIQSNGSRQCKKCVALHVRHVQKKAANVLMLAKALLLEMNEPLPPQFLTGVGAVTISVNAYKLIEQIRNEVNQKL